MTRLAWRRTWFQVHKWIGLILAVLIVPLSLSGAALVWDEALDRLIHPARQAVSGTALLAPDAYVAAARRVLTPGGTIAQLTLPEGRGPVVVAAVPPSAAPTAAPSAAPTTSPSLPGAATAPRAGPPVRTMVYLDPPTARVLAIASSADGPVRFLHRLHGSLMLPGVGRAIVGWIGVAMMVSSFTGLWLWWPTVGRWARGLRWRRHRDTDTNLHYLVGFWIALPLFVLSLTGAWIAFPAVFGAPGGGGPRRTGPDRAAIARAQPLGAPAQPLAVVLARAGSVDRGRLRSVAWPTTLSADWTVTFADGRSAKVADDSGAAGAVPARPERSLARLMRRIHDGTDMGPVWQAIIFVGGIMPAVLAVTGVIMWWRARRWRGDLAQRRSARAA